MIPQTYLCPCEQATMEKSESHLKEEEVPTEEGRSLLAARSLHLEKLSLSQQQHFLPS